MGVSVEAEELVGELASLGSEIGSEEGATLPDPYKIAAARSAYRWFPDDDRRMALRRAVVMSEIMSKPLALREPPEPL